MGSLIRFVLSSLSKRGEVSDGTSYIIFQFKAIAVSSFDEKLCWEAELG